MKVVWLISDLPREVVKSFGGSPAEVKGSWIDGMASAIARLGLEIKLIVICIVGKEFDITINGVRYIGIPCARRGLCKAGKVRKWAENRIRGKISEISPDIIHIHGTEQAAGTFHESVYCNVPVIVSIQGVLSQCYNAYTGGIPLFEIIGSEFNMRNLLKFTSVFSEQKWWGTERTEKEQFIFKRFKYFIGRTEFDRCCLECYNRNAKYFHGEESINSAFRKYKWDRAKARPHTIYCGNALGYGLKGGHWLIKAVSLLKDEFPDIKLNVAASASKLAKKRSFYEWLKASTYTVYIRRLIKKLGCEENVIGLPPLSPEQVANELATSELFVLPSVCENSPNTLCEAMMVGVPSIATFTGGIPSIMRPNVEGRLVQMCDPHVLAGEIRKFFRDHKYAESCVGAAMKRAKERHDDENNAKILYETYEQVLKLERE